jgi:hypothetical protein
MKTDPRTRLQTVVQLLRQQLGARSGRAAPGPAPAAGGGVASGRTPLAHVQALRDAGLSAEPLLQRALVEQLLAGGLGAGLVNEAPFQALVDDVLATLRTDPEMQALLQQAVAPAPQGAR